MDAGVSSFTDRGDCMNILVVDDDQATRDVVKEILEEEGHSVTGADSGEQALEILKTKAFPIVLSDIKMAGLDGMRLLTLVKEHCPSAVVILMTAFGNVETTVEAIRNGAFDYVSKPFRVAHLKTIVSRAVQHAETLAKFDSQAPIMGAELPARALIGKSPLMIEVYKTVGRAAISESSVVILGESGTGKERIARMIHENSRRKDGNFIPVNCAALTESLLESELFGHVKGAFTGATFQKRGLFEEAGGGTLFLDEVGDMPPSLQVKLLRTLQDGEIKPVGSHEVKRVDVRIIAATHKDIDALVKNGQFRDDLYYRLRVISITVPPLRDRSGDIPELVNHFVLKHARKSEKNISNVSEEAMRCLMAYSWPGNIRELEHAIERAIALASTSILFPEDFPPEISQKPDGTPSIPLTAEPEHQTAKSLDDIEKQHIVSVLREVGFNKADAARVLGIGRVTLYRKAKRYGIALDSKQAVIYPENDRTEGDSSSH